MEAFGKNPLEVAWTPDGSHILASGEKQLYLIARDTWDLNLSKDFSHKQNITCVSWLTDSIFATASLDKVVKLWNFNTKKLLHFFTS